MALIICTSRHTVRHVALNFSSSVAGADRHGLSDGCVWYCGICWFTAVCRSGSLKLQYAAFLVHRDRATGAAGQDRAALCSTQSLLKLFLPKKKKVKCCSTLVRSFKRGLISKSSVTALHLHMKLVRAFQTRESTRLPCSVIRNDSVQH